MGSPGHPTGPVGLASPRTGALDAVAIGKACVTASIAAIEGHSTGRRVNFPYVLVDVHTQALGKQLLKELG